LTKIEDGLKEVDDGWVRKWVVGEESILDEIITPYENMVITLNRNKLIKNKILESLNEISIQELQSCGVRAKPECHKIWCSNDAAKRVRSELKSIKNYISKL
jgi:hypothetical protein